MLKVKGWETIIKAKGSPDMSETKESKTFIYKEICIPKFIPVFYNSHALKTIEYIMKFCCVYKEWDIIQL